VKGMKRTIGFLAWAASIHASSITALAQYQGVIEYSPEYCMTYTRGVSELVGLENTFRGKDPDDLKNFAREYGSENVGNLYAILHQIETISLELRVINYSRDHNFSAPLPGDASDYILCLKGDRLFLHF
jgi:hypothetical protein